MNNIQFTGSVTGMENLTKSVDEIFKGLAGNSYVKVGILSGSNQRPDGGETNATIGVKHEFGSLTERVPARSFLRMPVEEKTKEIISDLKDIKMKDKKDVKTLRNRLLTKLGITIEGVIQDAFSTRGFGKWRPLSEYTLSRRRKGKDGLASDSPLIDTGELRRSITSKVINGK